MARYRVVEHKKDGYYKIYSVQEGYLFFFWEHIRSFDTLGEAQIYIKDVKTVRVSTVVHKE